MQISHIHINRGGTWCVAIFSRKWQREALSSKDVKEATCFYSRFTVMPAIQQLCLHVLDYVTHSN